MDTIQNAIYYVQAYINAVPSHSWYALGVLLASIPAVIGITAWVKRHHFKKTEQKLASEFIVLNVAFWGALATVADFVITNGQTFGPFLPFWAAHWPQVSGGAIAVHSVATASYKWWTDRKNNKPLTASVAAPDAPQANASLFPQQPQQRPVPSQDLLQL